MCGSTVALWNLCGCVPLRRCVVWQVWVKALKCVNLKFHHVTLPLYDSMSRDIPLPTPILPPSHTLPHPPTLEVLG